MNNKMQRRSFSGQLEVKLAEPGAEVAEKTFSGYGAVYGNLDFASDIIAPGAFADTLAEHKAAGTAPAMFFNHDLRSVPIGIWDELVEDEIGLKANGRFLDTTMGRDAYAAVKAGAVTGLSIGFFIEEESIEAGVRTIIKAKLLEISVVTFPCNTRARVGDVKSDTDMSDEDFLAALADLGVEEEDAKALLAKRNKSDDDDVEAAEEAEAEPADGKGNDVSVNETSTATIDDTEAKYIQTAIEAVSNLIRELKQENHGR